MLSTALAASACALAPAAFASSDLTFSGVPAPQLAGRYPAGVFSLGRFEFGRRPAIQVADAGTTMIDAGSPPLETRESAVDQFRQAGVEVLGLTPGTDLMRINARDLYEGKAVAAARDHVYSQTGSNEPVCFTLDFGRHVKAFRFQRAALVVGPNGVSHPWWRATALGADQQPLPGLEVGENKLVCLRGEKTCRTVNDAGTAFISSPVAIRSGTAAAAAEAADPVADARPFALTSSGIAAVRVCSKNMSSAFSGVVFESVEFER